MEFHIKAQTERTVVRSSMADGPAVTEITTIYVGGHQEWTDGVATNYYFHNGRRVAMRTGGDVSYLHADHLQSTTDTTGDDNSGPQLYYPYGETRSSAEVATEYQYTGQRWQDELGLYYYNARWYDPQMRRFVQADTIVPEPGNPQSLNRYSYALNNPVKYNDPSGFIAESEQAEAQAILDEPALYGATVKVDWGWYEYTILKGKESTPARSWVEGEWELAELQAVLQGTSDFARQLFGSGTDDGIQVFNQRINDVEFERRGACRIQPGTQGLAVLGKRVILYDKAFHSTGDPAASVVAHELAHIWDASPGENWSAGLFFATRREEKPTGYAETNAKEHWAESIMFYVYPMESGRLSGRPGLSPAHNEFISFAVKGDIWFPVQ